MAETFASEMLGAIRTLKQQAAARPGFRDHPDSRGFVVILCALEGALVFGDVAELADHCVAFCAQKEAESSRRN